MLTPKILIAVVLFLPLLGCHGDPGEFVGDPAPFTFSDLRVETSLDDCEATFPVRVRVAENRRLPTGRTLYLIHGALNNSNFYGPLIRWLFERYGDRLLRVYAVDLPGHGASDYDDSCRKFGELRLQDYASVNLKVLDAIRRTDGPVDLLAGHSMGGIIIQTMEQSLLGRRTDLSREFGVEGVLLAASSLPREVPLDVGRVLLSVGLELGRCLTLDSDPPDIYADCSRDVFFQVLFTNRHGEVVRGAPETEAQIDALKSRESLTAVILQNLFFRPSVTRGAFAGIRLATIAYADDVFFDVDEELQLHSHLLGGETEEGFFPVPGDQAVHMSLYTMPESTAEALDYLLQ